MIVLLWISTITIPTTFLPTITFLVTFITIGITIESSNSNFIATVDPASPPESNVTKEQAEKIAFPNDGKPPAEVTAFIEKTGDYMTKINNEKENKIVVEWLKNIKNAYLSPKIKTALKDLLAVTNFTSNMRYMKIFDPLQKFCQEELLRIGGPLQQLYRYPRN